MRWFSPIPLLRLLLQAGEQCEQTLLIAVQRTGGLLTQVFIVLVEQQRKGQLTSAPHILQNELQQVIFLPTLKLGHQPWQAASHGSEKWLKQRCGLSRTDIVAEIASTQKQTHMGHPLCAMAFSDWRIRLMDMLVSFSIWASENGCTTSANLNTFFLPLAPGALNKG